MWTKLYEWKRSVSYGLGVDIALPPCLLGGRLVSEFSSQYKWSVGGTVGVTYHGTRLWSYVEKYFILVPVFLCFWFPNVEPFRLRMLSIINDILDPRISTWRRVDDLDWFTILCDSFSSISDIFYFKHEAYKKKKSSELWSSQLWTQFK